MQTRPSVAEFVELLEEIAPSRDCPEWDNPGLQAGHPSREVQRVLISLDPTLQAVEEAARRKAEVLLSHHPVLFRPLLRLDTGHYPGNVLWEALTAGISMIAAHTNLDAAEGGLNDILARLLGLEDVQPLTETPASALVGTSLGRIGSLPQPISLSAMTRSAKSVFSLERVRVVGPMDAMVSRVAVVAGSGGSMIRSASQMGADLLITGDISHHQALEALQVGVALIDAGHFHTEKAALAPFADALQGALAHRNWDVLVQVYHGERDPFHDE